MQFNGDWTHSFSSLLLSLLLLDPLALLNAKHREGFLYNECENINLQFLPNLSLFPLLKLLVVWRAKSFPSAGDNVLKSSDCLFSCSLKALSNNSNEIILTWELLTCRSDATVKLAASCCKLFPSACRSERLSYCQGKKFLKSLRHVGVMG